MGTVAISDFRQHVNGQSDGPPFFMELKSMGHLVNRHEVLSAANMLKAKMQCSPSSTGFTYCGAVPASVHEGSVVTVAVEQRSGEPALVWGSCCDTHWHTKPLGTLNHF